MKIKPSPATAQLIAALASGANQMLFTPDSWAARLGDSAESKAFMVQLRHEWMPLTIPNTICTEVMDFVRRYIGWYVGWANLWAHTLRVIGYALALADEAGISADQAFILAVFHDIGKFDEHQGVGDHTDIGSQLLLERLKDHYPLETIAVLSGVISKRARRSDPLYKLMHDADKLDKIGATGITRRLSSREGGEYIEGALLRVRHAAQRFPAMNFTTAQHLADEKLEFTDAFLRQVRNPR